MQTATENLTFNNRFLNFLGGGIIVGLAIMAIMAINSLNNFKIPALMLCLILILFTGFILGYNYYTDHLNRLKLLMIPIEDKEAFIKKFGKVVKKFGYKIIHKNQDTIEFELSYKYGDSSHLSKRLQIRLEEKLGIIQGPKSTIEQLEEDLEML